MSPSQDDIFVKSEGDRWYARNKGVLDSFDPQHDVPMRLMEMYGLRPSSVLEVGSSNGFRLAAIRGKWGIPVVGVEASEEAISDGRSRFPGVTLIRGAVSNLPVSEAFELVIVNFLFHWIDRMNLLKAAAEVDRSVAEGGHLLIGDFLPSNRHRVRYHHLPEEDVHTFKQDYAGIFLASGLYHPVALLTRGHASKEPVAGGSGQERGGVWLLEKRSFQHYDVVDLRP